MGALSKVKPHWLRLGGEHCVSAQRLNSCTRDSRRAGIRRTNLLESLSQKRDAVTRAAKVDKGQSRATPPPRSDSAPNGGQLERVCRLLRIQLLRVLLTGVNIAKLHRVERLRRDPHTRLHRSSTTRRHKEGKKKTYPLGVLKVDVVRLAEVSLRKGESAVSRWN